jgi:hypothetical protein
MFHVKHSSLEARPGKEDHWPRNLGQRESEVLAFVSEPIGCVHRLAEYPEITQLDVSRETSAKGSIFGHP